jgi:hypothetical protein
MPTAFHYRVPHVVMILVIMLTTSHAFGGQLPIRLQLSTSLADPWHSPENDVDSLAALRDLPSPDHAQTLSVLTTVLPITAGLLLNATSKENHVVEYDAGGSPTGFHDENAQQTLAALVFLGGLIIGPSSGYFYGGCSERGTKGVFLRLGTGAAALMIASAVSVSSENGDWYEFKGLWENLRVIGVGFGLVVLEAILDVTKVDRIVREQNSKRLGTQINLELGQLPSTNAIGLSLSAGS